MSVYIEVGDGCQEKGSWSVPGFEAEVESTCSIRRGEHEERITTELYRTVQVESTESALARVARCGDAKALRVLTE